MTTLLLSVINVGFISAADAKTAGSAAVVLAMAVAFGGVVGRGGVVGEGRRLIGHRVGHLA